VVDNSIEYWVRFGCKKGNAWMIGRKRKQNPTKTGICIDSKNQNTFELPAIYFYFFKLEMCLMKDRKTSTGKVLGVSLVLRIFCGGCR
jgi:hypothetical protein